MTVLTVDYGVKYEPERVFIHAEVLHGSPPRPSRGCGIECKRSTDGVACCRGLTENRPRLATQAGPLFTASSACSTANGFAARLSTKGVQCFKIKCLEFKK